MACRILAIVVTYFPEKELIEKNIYAFIDHVDKVIIWENTPKDKKHLYRYINNPKVEYCGDGVNSISHALNYAWKYAEKNGYDYLLTMDQDSVFEDFSYYLKYTVYAEKAPHGIWSPWIVSHEFPKKKCLTEDMIEMKTAITSGLLQKVSLISELGGWNEGFDIDGIDDEYVFNAARKGIKTYAIRNAFLVQQYGRPRNVSLGGHSVSLPNYSPRRYYSIYLTHVQLMRMFPEQEMFKLVCREHWLGLIKWIFVFEDQRFSKLYNIIRGVLTGYLCKLPTRKS